mmetsp:Transcript_94662/g.197770  ORF Transcript_94662/g.197770 Transcript_94662/m.197770 type:complete len:259 (+) Transcript_94662:729-1505(+)
MKSFATHGKAGSLGEVDDVAWREGHVQSVLPENSERFTDCCSLNPALLGKEVREPELGLVGSPSIHATSRASVGWVGSPEEFIVIIWRNLEGGSQRVRQGRQVDFAAHEELGVSVRFQVVLEGHAFQQVASSTTLSEVAFGRLLRLGEHRPIGQIVVVVHQVPQEGVTFPANVGKPSGVVGARRAFAIHSPNWSEFVAPRQVLVILRQHDFQVLLVNATLLNVLHHGGRPTTAAVVRQKSLMDIFDFGPIAKYKQAKY